MKKSLIALAVLAAASGAAMAQSSVTLFGVVDATVRYNDADAGRVLSPSRGGSAWSLTNSGYNSSRIGFRGTEDLGGGLNASFWLEAGVNNDNGTGSTSSTNNTPAGTVSNTATGSQGLTFNRRSTVSLAGTWGEVRLGRDYVPYFWNTTIFDPFGTNGVGAVSNFTLKGLSVISGGAVNTTAGGVRASNSIGYFMPNIAGFYGQLMYAMGENLNVTATGASNPAKNNGNVGSARVGWAAGPVDVAIGWGATTFAPQQQYQVVNIGASFNFGVVKLMGLANWEDGDATPNPILSPQQQTPKIRTYMVGASMPMGAGELKGSFTYGNASYDLLDGQQYAIGYVYNLSKRTALYTTGSYIVNNASGPFNAIAAAGVYSMGINPGVGGNTWGLDFGVKHSF